MSNHWAPSGLISRDFECKKSVSLCVILVQMPLSNFTLHLPYSPDGGAPAGVKWGHASLSSIHLMRRRRKSRDRRRAATDGQQLPKKNNWICSETSAQISCFTTFTSTGSCGRITHSPISCTRFSCTHKLHTGRPQTCCYEENHSKLNRFYCYIFFSHWFFLLKSVSRIWIPSLVSLQSIQPTCEPPVTSSLIINVSIWPVC